MIVLEVNEQLWKLQWEMFSECSVGHFSIVTEFMKATFLKSEFHLESVTTRNGGNILQFLRITVFLYIYNQK